MARYKLLIGRHVVKGHKAFVATEPGNNVVESDVDLVKKFGADKFQRLEDVPQNLLPNGENDGLDEMTVAKLRQFASDQQIDLGNATKKDEIISILRAAADE